MYRGCREEEIVQIIVRTVLQVTNKNHDPVSAPLKPKHRPSSKISHFMQNLFTARLVLRSRGSQRNLRQFPAGRQVSGNFSSCDCQITQALLAILSILACHHDL